MTWTATTSFTKQQAGSATDVTVGVCAVVRPPDGATATGDSGSAANVQISPAAADGSCSGTLSGMPQPTDAPNGAPAAGSPGQGAPTGRGGAGAFFGRVTAVSGGSFTVARIMPGGEGTTSTASPVTVTTSGGTAYTTTVKASATDVAVGQCATAQGQASETGAVTATSVALRAPVSGSCFGGGGIPAGGATGG